MSKVFINESTLKDIGDAIRKKTGGSALISPKSMSDEIDKIQGEDAFWDAAFDYGNRDYFAYAFGPVFNDDNFKPPTTILPRTRYICYRNADEGRPNDCEHLRWNGDSNSFYCYKYGRIANESSKYVATSMFQSTSIGHINRSHVDWNCVPSMADTFASASNLKSVTGINAKNCTNMQRLFWWCHNLETVEFLNYRKVTNWSDAFYKCTALKNVTFSAEYIDKEELQRIECINASIDFSDCTELTKESITNIINALGYNDSHPFPLYLTLSKTAVENAFLSNEQTKTFKGVMKWNEERDGATIDGMVFVRDGQIVALNCYSDFGKGYLYDGDWVDDYGNIVTVSAADAPIGTYYFLTYKDETKIPQSIIDTYNSFAPTSVDLTLHRTVENPTLDTTPEWVELDDYRYRSGWSLSLI